MPLAYWPGSSTEKRLREIAARLHGRVARDFSGIICGETKILYRHGTFYYQTAKDSRYPRWAWKIPFGRKKDWSRVDFVLLYGPGRGAVRESFFLFGKNEAARNYAMWPDRLNMAAEPLSTFGNTDRLRARQMDVSKVEEIIKHHSQWGVRRSLSKNKR